MPPRFRRKAEALSAVSTAQAPFSSKNEDDPPEPCMSGAQERCAPARSGEYTRRASTSSTRTTRSAHSRYRGMRVLLNQTRLDRLRGVQATHRTVQEVKGLLELLQEEVRQLQDMCARLLPDDARVASGNEARADLEVVA
ncbi:hypothetical protein POSPLADRAFT_1052304 [Postia placenta MAD-698-R-SB12]|uniref:Uncharacterized protein n=1 Tax=Postia placenta MAD-698-R-SB12 TaxID=670580 RepID=A0A1X6NIA8_9APHY|nr:hypothetical protein POSPLADRAFT_1052304 [Postia placenta MAD-698-R-SB12]OSX68176.1 hypothetical protein POSPLADRAFT_1052304 [Postia placenta MAD-698-R-SB12]